MNKYEHITEMENILNAHQQKLEELNGLLDFFEAHQEDYEKLVAYYYSDQRSQDLEDEEKHLIPEDLRRGVLSEDGIYNFTLDHYDAGIRMMEIALKMIKSR